MDPRLRRGGYSSQGDGGAKIAPRRPGSGRGYLQGAPAPAFSVNDFKGTFSFDDFFSSLVGDILPPANPSLEADAISSGSAGAARGFPEAEVLLPMFKDARRDLIDLSQQVDAKLGKLRAEVVKQDTEHKETLSKLEQGVEGLFERFGRLDARISGVGQTATRIGDHLQSADAQRDTASHTIELIKYLMDFNSSRGDLLQYSPPAAVFSDDLRMGEAATIARKLRSFAAGDSRVLHLGESGSGQSVPSPGLEVAADNLDEYCSDLENKLLSRFDFASQQADKATMVECAKILEQFQGGTRASHRYVASRPMFLDVDLMNADIIKVVADGPGGQASGPARGLPALYKEIISTVREEASLVGSVFPNPKIVMALLVQRVMEQRVYNVLEHLLPLPSLDDPPPVSKGGLLAYLRTLAAAYEKTKELAKELRSAGCGDLDVEGLAESLFTAHRESYHEVEMMSLMQLFHAKDMNQANPGGQAAEGLPRSRSGFAPAGGQGAVGVVGEYVRWNEEAIARCRLLTSESGPLVENVQLVFGTLLDQVREYTMMGLSRAENALQEAAALRDKVTLGTSVSRRLAAAVANVAEQAALAGEQGIRTFLKEVKRAAANVTIVQQHFVSTVARALEGSHARFLEDIALRMAPAEQMVLAGLQSCLAAAFAEVERLLQLEQKATDFKPPDDGAPPDHRPTRACIQVITYLQRIADMAYASLDGPNRQAFFAELGGKLHRSLLAHVQKFTFTPSGGLRLKRDASEYADFVRTFKTPAVDEKFETFNSMVNFFVVAPESLLTLVEGSRLSQAEAQSFIQLRDDYKSSKIGNYFRSLGSQ